MSKVFMSANEYSNPPNTEPSNIRMVIFWTLFVSDYRTVRFLNGRFYKICPDFFPAKLDCFEMNKIFVMTLFFIKRSRLVKSSRIGPVLQYLSSFRMVKTRWLPKKYLTSLDRFINKGHKNILFMPKWSRLVTGNECPLLA
jgi:hypothetical protein